MRDEECVRFLQWALPQMGFAWPGFRRVRGQVCKRLRRRLGELGLGDLAAYRRRLAEDPGEWPRLDALCRITISRFYRDRHVFDVLAGEVLPRLARLRADARLRLWCAGCASGEEPYTLAILGRHAPALAGIGLEIVATDADPGLLARARRATYPPGCLRELPAAWRAAAFAPAAGGELRLRAAYRQAVGFRRQDLRRAAPGGAFDAVLCRNLAFTYFAPDLQRRVAARLRRRLRRGGVLVLGGHEALPEGTAGFAPWPGEPAIQRRAEARDPA